MGKTECLDRLNDHPINREREGSMLGPPWTTESQVGNSAAAQAAAERRVRSAKGTRATEFNKEKHTLE